MTVLIVAIISTGIEMSQKELLVIAHTRDGVDAQYSIM